MFITKSQLHSYRRGFDISNEYVAPIQASATAANSFQADTSVFLSHSHKDKELIEPTLAFLRSHGVKIYVDWMDEGMSDTISGETAKKLKDRIRQQKKFLLLITENSKDSRWVPWELGYADSTKGMSHIAALPVANNTDFTHNEYLDIYPKVVVLNGAWKVYQADPPAIVDLTNWFRR